MVITIMNNSSIGVLDSGMGGLSILRELRVQLPGESFIYWGDGKNCPYGPKPVDEVIGYVDAGVQLLVGKGIKMLVLACNAATAAAVGFLRAKYDFPIVGMEPAVKPAVLTTKSGVVGVLATANTLRGELFRTTSAGYANRARIIPAVGEGFVELVENGREDSPEAFEAVRRVVEPLLDAGVDRLVLGCTHYPFLRKTIEKVIAGRDVELVDSAPAVARRVAAILRERDLAASPDHRPVCEFFTAGDDEYLGKLEVRSER